MTDLPSQITLDQWEVRYPSLYCEGTVWPDYCGPLARHVSEGDLRLNSLLFDNSAGCIPAVELSAH